MAAPKEILELVKRFEDNLEAYKSGKYNETQLRLEFIDPFLKLLLGKLATSGFGINRGFVTFE